jgi:Ni,Fe-hydrogenase III component G
MIALSLAMALSSALTPVIYGLTEQTLDHLSYPLSAMWLVIVIDSGPRALVKVRVYCERTNPELASMAAAFIARPLAHSA